MTVAPLMALRQVGKVYGSPHSAVVTALQGVDLVVEGDGYLAVTGRSGSGKSTLLGILGLLMAPTTGEVLVEGATIQGLTDDGLTAARAGLVGFVFQQFHLVPHLSAVQNVETALFCRGLSRIARRDAALEALARVGVGNRFDHRPSELSGGEQQRVAIARAIVAGPRLLLADEPTGNLDTATGAQVMEVLESFLGPGHALVVVTHDPAIAARARHRVDLADGRVTACSPLR